MRYLGKAKLRRPTDQDQNHRFMAWDEFYLQHHVPGPNSNRDVLLDIWRLRYQPVVAVLQSKHLRSGESKLRGSRGETFEDYAERSCRSGILVDFVEDSTEIYFVRGQLWIADQEETEDVDGFHLLLEAAARQRERDKERRLARARVTVQAREDSVGHVRRAIPDDVKMFVWRRDQGRCVRCETNVDLEFDHVIPLVMGGGDTARNLQLLCGACNRAKGGNLV